MFPPFQLIIDNGQLSTNGSLPGVQIVNCQPNHQWQQDLPGFQNLQLRVQLRTFTGFPFTNRQRVFQDPMTGTATTMSIEENMAIAARRGKSRGLRWGITKAEREKYREMLSTLHLGLEDRLTSKVGLLSGGQRQAITLLMASIQKPKLLLLDEHTAALDPKTAAKVLEISDQIISDNHLTAMMVTHNMKDAIAHGNRLIMMHEGKVILNIAGEDKKKLTVGDLLHQFEKVSGEEFASDKALLS